MRYVKLLWDLYQLKRNIKKSAARIQKLQGDKLQKVLTYAYQHSAYYRRTFEENGITRCMQIKRKKCKKQTECSKSVEISVIIK